MQMKFKTVEMVLNTFTREAIKTIPNTKIVFEPSKKKAWDFSHTVLLGFSKSHLLGLIYN